MERDDVARGLALGAIGKTNAMKAAVDLNTQRLTNLIENTPEEAEVTDIRVGADGVTYDTAGDAVRGQVTTLKEDLENLEDDVDEISADVSALQTKESATERSLEMLWKLNKGQTYDIESQTESGTNDAPSGAEYETLEEVYGKSSQQTTNGYQLLDYTDLESGKIIDTTTGQEKVQNNASSTKTYVPCKATKIYFSNLLGGIRAYFYEEDKTYISSVYATSGMANVPTDTAFVKFAGATSNFAEDSSVSTNETIIEPYTGGIPQPNPSYPSEIVDVTEEHFKVVDNLFDIDSWFADYTDAPNGANVKVHQMNIPNGTYTLSTNSGTSTEADVFSSLTLTSVSTTTYGVLGSKTVTVNNGKLFVYIRASKLDNFRNGTSYVRLDKGTSAKKDSVSVTTKTMSYTLRGIGDYTDVMDVEKGKIKHNIGRFKAKGTLAYASSLTRWQATINDMVLDSNSYPIMSDFAKYSASSVAGSNTIRKASGSKLVIFYGNADVVFNDNWYVDYLLATPTEESISAGDLAFLRGLENLSADHTITVTDQNGNDISYLVEYIIKLSEVV